MKEYSYGQGIKIAILDSGISPDLGIPVAYGLNTFAKGQPIEDGAGHGSAIASIVKRVAPLVELYDFKVLDKKGIGTQSSVLDGINLARAWNVDIAIVSLGANDMFASPMFTSAFKKLAANGTAILGATGNEGQYGINEPASYEGVWSIGSIDNEGKHSKFSNYGDVDFVATGDKIPALTPDGYITEKTGTSFSVPVFAGMLAMTLQLAKSIGYDKINTNQEKYDLIKHGCQEVGNKTDYGNGYPRGDLLLEYLRTLKK